jgi:uncharacterized membrane protein
LKLLIVIALIFIVVGISLIIAGIQIDHKRKKQEALQAEAIINESNARLTELAEERRQLTENIFDYDKDR